MSDANIAKKIISAAIYAALADGGLSEINSGRIYCYESSSWLIAVTLRRDPKAPRTDTLVKFNGQDVFHAVQGADPEVVTFVRGEWETQLLEEWGTLR
jgi:hypothetical protein